MQVAVIDYGSGNLHSVLQSLKTAVAAQGLPHDCFLTNDAAQVAVADYIVLPGVGAYADCAQGLANVDGMTEVLQEIVIDKARPFLGICVGMQLMAERGTEDGITKGLGWLKGSVDKLTPQQGATLPLKIPHMGWNGLNLTRPHPVFNDINDGDAVYFVHSYHLTDGDDDHLLATADYGGRVVAAIGQQNMVGTQFHPEKSQHIGQRLLANWLNWKP